MFHVERFSDLYVRALQNRITFHVEHYDQRNRIRLVCSNIWELQTRGADPFGVLAENNVTFHVEHLEFLFHVEHFVWKDRN